MFNRSLLLLLAGLSVFHAMAQKGWEGLVHAERFFADHSVRTTTREAFLLYMDSSAILFDSNRVVNGVALWTKRDNRPGRLSWEPQFAEISASGEFGYTTGPWEFRAKTYKDSVQARGQYITVWHFNSEFEWKFLVDIGIRYPQENQVTETIPVEVKKINAGNKGMRSLLKAENDFMELLQKDRPSAYRRYLSLQHSILLREGKLPALTAADQQVLIDSLSEGLTCTREGIQMARSADLAFTYGYATVQGNKGNYLRIWRREKAGWKIALEVVR